MIHLHKLYSHVADPHCVTCCHFYISHFKQIDVFIIYAIFS